MNITVLISQLSFLTFAISYYGQLLLALKKHENFTINTCNTYNAGINLMSTNRQAAHETIKTEATTYSLTEAITTQCYVLLEFTKKRVLALKEQIRRQQHKYLTH